LRNRRQCDAGPDDCQDRCPFFSLSRNEEGLTRERHAEMSEGACEESQGDERREMIGIEKKKPDTTDQRMMTASEVADHLRINIKTVYRLAAKRRIPGAFKVAREWRFDREAILNCLLAE